MVPGLEGLENLSLLGGLIPQAHFSAKIHASSISPVFAQRANAIGWHHCRWHLLLEQTQVVLPPGGYWGRHSSSRGRLPEGVLSNYN